ncbi:sugar phosphate isomerase/epimerase [Paenibacillus sp. YN15]|uniref:sugar phosphate isomerase/epimerase family protein n=1 Tax=Paenibacillus sp. YN15 TaxID=1742774 RepID=UPI0015EC79E4|nr:mannonate dehydratase [Paenibacillus sp. YN15]
MKVSIAVGSCDLADNDLKQLSQLGVDCVDLKHGNALPGVKEQGYPDLDGLLRLKRRIRSYGMEINRVTLPDLSKDFMSGQPGSEAELENAVQAMRVFGEAGLTLARQRLSGDVFPYMSQCYMAQHRGGAGARGEALVCSPAEFPPAAEQMEEWWERFILAFGRLVPVAEEYNMNLAVHPSDTPHFHTPFAGPGLHRVIDAFPSRNVGYVYCVGTRGEAGGTPLVLDEIHEYGRKNRIFLVHLRNVRGSLATAGAFEESLLDDGHMNLPKILLALHKVGYNGCINPDHITNLQMDRVYRQGGHEGLEWVAWSYSIGYVKALLASLAEFCGERW